MRILANLNVVGTLDIDTVTNAAADTDRFLVQDANGVVRYRTGAEVASDIGAAVGYVSTIKHEVKLAEAVGKGKAIYISGSDGTNMLASLASNASEATSTKTLGLTESAGAQNAKVFVVSEGLLAGLNTSTATIGDPVWLGVDGELIYGLNNKPYAPAHMVFVGLVTRVNANNGEIFVKVQNGFELQELHNVQITTTPANNTVLAYETSSSLYKMKSIPTLLGYTPADDAGVVHLAGTETITGTKSFTAATTTFAKVVANSPTGGATGEGLVVGSSFKLDASGVGQSAKIYVVTKDLSDTYGSGLQIQFANIDDNKGFGFNLNTAGGYELYTKDAGAAWVKAMTVSNAQLATFHGNVKLANYTSNGFVKTTNSDGTISIDTTSYQPTSEKGQINGYASLDGAGKVPSTQLPSYVDDVVEYANLAGFPVTGETGKIYVALDTNKIYRWSGTAYVEVSPTVGTIWGSITGTLSNQTDLQSALDAKVPTTREITINGTTYDLSANRTWNVGTVTGSGTANQLAYWNGSSSVAGSTFLTLNLTADNGYLILTGGATYKNADIWLNRYSDAWENAIRFQTNGATDWYLGSSATGSNSNLEFYSYGTTSAALTLLRSNANAIFGGSVGINNTSLTGYSLRVSRTMVGDTASGITSFGIVSDGVIQSGVTSGAFGFNSSLSTASATFTLDALIHYRATQGSISGTSTVNNQYGFAALGTMTGATNNYGFFGSLDSATGRWNLYMSGTARNYLAGDTSIGTTTGGYKLNVSGTSNFSGALTGTVGTFSDTLTGTGLRSFAVNTAQTPSNNAGWYTLARFNTYAPFLNTNGNSGIITLSFYGGGLYTPSRYRIFYFKDDANVATLKLEKYGAVDYIQEVRIRYRTGDTRYYIEIYCDSHASGLTFDVHHDRLLGYGDQLEIFGGVLSAANAVGTILASLPFVDHGTTMSSLNVVTSASFSSSLTANSFVKSGGIASQFLKADGTVDSTTYQPALTNPVTGTGTANQIAYWTSSSEIGALSTATYPSLTELSYVKGVTSGIQAQLDAKLNLSGGTLTGTLNGTSATFSGNVQANNQNAYLLYQSANTTDTKYWGIQNLTTSGDFRIRALNDTITNGINAIVISRTAISSVSISLGGALSGTSATFNVGSATTVLGLTGNGNSATIASITNTDTGSSARSSFQVTSDSSTAHFFASSSTNVSSSTGGRASTAGIFTASGDTAGGLAFLARNAAGVITFHTGGNTERVRIAANGEATFSSSVTASSLVKSGGTSSQFLKADGTVDSNTYLTSYTETDTLATVTGRGASTSTFIALNNASQIANNTNVDPVSYANKIVAGSVGDSGWRVTTGIGGNAGTNHNWTLGHNGSNLYFGISNGSTAALGTWMQVSPARVVRLNSYTTNGFVKFSNSDGTLSVDTNTYLTSYTETDTLSTVLARGNTSSLGATFGTAANALYTGPSGFIRINTNTAGGDTRNTQSTALLLTNYGSDLGTDGTVDIDFVAVDSNSVVGAYPHVRIGYTGAYNDLVNSSPDGEARGYFRIATRGEGSAGVLADRLVINHAGTLRLNNYTTNGFVKFSNSDGTLSVDTNTYQVAGTYLTPTNSDFTYNSVLTLNTTWQNTGVTTSNLSTGGVYIVTCFANDYNDGGAQYSCTYTGIMYWYGGGTNSSSTVSEIPLHHSGHHDGGRFVFLRTQSSLSADGKTYLQIKGNGTNTANSTYAFTFKRIL